MRGLRPVLAALLATTLVMPAGPAAADEIEETITAALEAYRDGDIKAAKEELDFASTLLGQLQAEGLAQFLPPALDGWTREDAETETQSLGMMGGGQMASSVYEGPEGSVEIQLMAGNQMVTAMAQMFANPALMGAMGTVKRINRQKLVVTPQDELNALVNNVMVQISGTAPVEAKEAYFAVLDLEGLEDF